MVGREMGPRTNGRPAAARLARWVDSIGSATLPLLAGFSAASVIVVSDDAANFRWPGAAILALAIAAVVLIAAVQCAYHARIYLPDKSIREVSPGFSPDGDDREDNDARSQQQDDYQLGLAWTRWTQRAYHCGIVALLAGLALAVAPQPCNGHTGCPSMDCDKHRIRRVCWRSRLDHQAGIPILILSMGQFGSQARWARPLRPEAKSRGRLPALQHF